MLLSDQLLIFTFNKLKSRGVRATSLSTYAFSTLYTTLPHNFIKEKLSDLIERTFQKKDLFTLFVVIEMLSSRLKSIKGTHNDLAKRCVKPSRFFWTIGTKIYGQIVGIPMGTCS